MSRQPGGRSSVGEAEGRSWALIIVVAFVALAIVDSRRQTATSPPGAVETYDVGQAGKHTDGDVDFRQTPLAGGEDNPV